MRWGHAVRKAEVGPSCLPLQPEAGAARVLEGSREGALVWSGEQGAPK